MSIVRSIPLALLITIPALAQEKHQLRLRFVPGTVVHYSMGQEMDMKMNMAGTDMGQKMNMQMFMTTAIKGVTGNVADLEQEFTRITAKVNGPMMDINYDSDVEDSDPGMLGDMSDMVGEKTRMSLSDMGKIMKVDVPDAVAESAKQSGIDVKDMMSRSTTLLPEQPVAIGETWTNKQKMPMGQMGEVDTEIINKLISVDDKFIVVEQVMKMDTSKMEMPGGMTVEKMESTGTNKIDLRTGMPAEMNTTMKMTMAGQMKMEMTVKQTVKQTDAPKKKEMKDGEKKGDAKEAGK